MFRRPIGALRPCSVAGHCQRAGRVAGCDGATVLSTHMGQDEPAYDANNPIVRGGQPVSESTYLTDALTREAVDFIEHKRRPFFLYLAYNAVHSPLQASDRYMRRFQQIEDIHRRIFAGMLSNLDDSVGAVLAKLRERDLERNTLVFFISDNGGPTRELTSSNEPLRGGKGDVYEGGLRVPFLVQWKSVIPASGVFAEPVVSLDIFATAAAAASLPPAERPPCDGVDLVPFLSASDGAIPHEILFWRMRGRTALRARDWKLVPQPGAGKRNADWQLYNLSQDIGESRDLAESQRAKLAELVAIWDRMNGEMLEPFWKPAR